MPSEITLPYEFASRMQELSAEAEKSTAPGSRETTERESEFKLYRDLAVLVQRMSGLERSFAHMVAGNSTAPESNTEVNARLQRMEEQLAALCQTESVNHRLFNSLHQELRDYRDNFLRESLQKPFIRDLVILFDDLSSTATQMESAASSAKKAGTITQWSANLQNSISTLLEVLHRMDVDPIEAKERVDPALHRVVSYEPSQFAEEDGRIVMRVKRGFIWRGQVLRPEEVVAKRFA